MRLFAASRILFLFMVLGAWRSNAWSSSSVAVINGSPHEHQSAFNGVSGYDLSWGSEIDGHGQQRHLMATGFREAAWVTSGTGCRRSADFQPRGLKSSSWKSAKRGANSGAYFVQKTHDLHPSMLYHLSSRSRNLRMLMPNGDPAIRSNSQSTSSTEVETTEQQNTLPGPCQVQIPFHLCSLVGKKKTFSMLNKIQEVPGSMSVVDVVIMKERETHYQDRGGCSCKKAFAVMASLNVTTEEEAKLYQRDMKRFFEKALVVDTAFACIDYGIPRLAGDGCPSAEPTTTVDPGGPLSITAAGASAPSSTMDMAAFSGEEQANAVLASTYGQSVTEASPREPLACAVLKRLKVCVKNIALFARDTKRREKELVDRFRLKRKSIFNILKFFDITGDDITFCANDLAVEVLVNIPVATPEEGNSMLQAIDSLGSFLIGQQLPTVLGGIDGGRAVTICGTYRDS